jgi:thiol-disulfide isomerase/thioredoxin
VSVFFPVLLPGLLCAETKTIAKGASFPHTVFHDHLTAAERSYMGLSGKKTFSLKDLQGTVFIIEIFSTYCMSCPKDVPILNAVHSAIENAPALKGKVKVIAVAVGNSAVEVGDFKKDYALAYPVLTDVNFTLHKALGNPRVPLTLWIKKTGRGLVLDVHQGLLDSSDAVLQRARTYLR